MLSNRKLLSVLITYQCRHFDLPIATLCLITLCYTALNVQFMAHNSNLLLEPMLKWTLTRENRDLLSEGYSVVG